MKIIKKQAILLCIVSSVILLLSSCIPTVYSHQIEKDQKNIIIETTLYTDQGPITKHTTMTVQEALKIKQLLINLNQAIEIEDTNLIKFYTQQLQSAGLLEKQHLDFLPNENQYLAETDLFHHQHLLSSNTTLSNALCYLHAVGEGFILFSIGLLLTPLIIALIINLLPLLGVIMLICLGILLITHAIPIRFFMPFGLVQMKKGTVSTLGLAGYQQKTLEAEESLTLGVAGFTGITINLPPLQEDSDGFLFVSGISILTHGKTS
jgi:hypothetical protein